MCACGKPECPSCKGVKGPYLYDDFATNKVTYTLKTSKEQQEQMLAAIQGFPADVTATETIPWDKPEANPLADISAAIQKYKANYYPPNGYPEKIKVTPTQYSLLKSFAHHEYENTPYMSPVENLYDPLLTKVFGVPVEVTKPAEDIYMDTEMTGMTYKKMAESDALTAELMHAFGFAKGGVVSPKKTVEGKSAFMGVLDEITFYPEKESPGEEITKTFKKLTSAVKKAISAFAAWHEVTRHHAYHALGLDETYGANPYAPGGSVPSPNVYEPDWDELPPEAMTKACVVISEEHVANGVWDKFDKGFICHDCKDNGGLLPEAQKLAEEKQWAKMQSFAKIYGGGPKFFTSQPEPYKISLQTEQPPTHIKWDVIAPPLKNPKPVVGKTHKVLVAQVEELKAGDQVIITVAEDGTLVLPEGMAGFVVRK